jgi:hypothetical protein
MKRKEIFILLKTIFRLTQQRRKNNLKISYVGLICFYAKTSLLKNVYDKNFNKDFN